MAMLNYQMVSPLIVLKRTEGILTQVQRRMHCETQETRFIMI